MNEAYLSCVLSLDGCVGTQRLVVPSFQLHLHGDGSRYISLRYAFLP
jgi:hypothetical protein